MRTLLELQDLAYSDMTDEEIELVLDFKIEKAVNEAKNQFHREQELEELKNIKSLQKALSDAHANIVFPAFTTSLQKTKSEIEGEIEA